MLSAVEGPAFCRERLKDWEGPADPSTAPGPKAPKTSPQGATSIVILSEGKHGFIVLSAVEVPAFRRERLKDPGRQADPSTAPGPEAPQISPQGAKSIVILSGGKHGTIVLSAVEGPAFRREHLGIPGDKQVPQPQLAKAPTDLAQHDPSKTGVREANRI